MSKRKLNLLVTEQVVEGWDDPRMPTVSGLRRRGYTPAAIREFCRRIGVTKQDNTVEMSALESCIREDLNENCAGAMAVLRPLASLELDRNFARADQTETLTVSESHRTSRRWAPQHIPFAVRSDRRGPTSVRRPNKQFQACGAGQGGAFCACLMSIKADTGSRRMPMGDISRLLQIRCRDAGHGSGRDGRIGEGSHVHSLGYRRALAAGADPSVWTAYCRGHPGAAERLLSTINPNVAKPSVRGLAVAPSLQAAPVEKGSLTSSSVKGTSVRQQAL
jgi:glutaminyl-tRNA synthetase